MATQVLAEITPGSLPSGVDHLLANEPLESLAHSSPAPPSDPPATPRPEPEMPKVVADEMPELAVDEMPEAEMDETPKVVADESPKVVADEMPEAEMDESPEAVADEMIKAVADEMTKAEMDESPKAEMDEMTKVVAAEMALPPIIESAEPEVEGPLDGAHKPSAEPVSMVYACIQKDLYHQLLANAHQFRRQFTGCLGEACWRLKYTHRHHPLTEPDREMVGDLLTDMLAWQKVWQEEWSETAFMLRHLSNPDWDKDVESHLQQLADERLPMAYMGQEWVRTTRIKLGLETPSSEDEDLAASRSPSGKRAAEPGEMPSPKRPRSVEPVVELLDEPRPEAN